MPNSTDDILTRTIKGLRTLAQVIKLGEQPNTANLSLIGEITEQLKEIQKENMDTLEKIELLQSLADPKRKPT